MFAFVYKNRHTGLQQVNQLVYKEMSYNDDDDDDDDSNRKKSDLVSFCRSPNVVEYKMYHYKSIH